MEKHFIDLNSFLSKGHIRKEIKKDVLLMSTTRRLTAVFDKANKPVNDYIYLPDTYKLPLRIDFTFKIDSPGLYVFLGNGHLNFGTPWSDNRRIDDIIEPSYKVRFFHNHIPMNEYVSLSIIYDFKAMQILINGAERFYSKKEKYMKSKLLNEFNDAGLSFKMACSKRTELSIKSLCITEYEAAADIIDHKDGALPEPCVTNEAVQSDKKAEFENSISLLPKEIQDEIFKTDDFLRSLRPIKFRRQIEKHGNKITYLASDCGFSYAIYPSNDVMYHSLSWYIITSSKPEQWHRKADMMETVLKKLAETSPEFAERMFYNLTECISCRELCTVKTLYELNEKKKLTCHGLMDFKMCASDFEDVRAFISAINELS